MGLSQPARWYITFWVLAGIVALAPIYILLWKIYRKL